MKSREYFEKLFSKEFALSTEVPSNSNFLVVRELEARISKSVLPILVLANELTPEQAKQRIEKVLNDLSKEGHEFWLLYKFGAYLGAGLLPNPEKLTLKQFQTILDAKLAKAFSFDSALSFVHNVVDSFVENIKKLKEITIDKLARYLKSNLNSISHQIYESGVISSLAGEDDADNIYVIRIVYPGACKYCKQVFLNADGSPKVFRLSDLVANGHDLRRKPTEYVPVLTTLHYNCRCGIARVSPEWDKDKLFDVLTDAWDSYELVMKAYEESLTE